jgi:hypothetical protein
MRTTVIDKDYSNGVIIILNDVFVSTSPGLTSRLSWPSSTTSVRLGVDLDLFVRKNIDSKSNASSFPSFFAKQLTVVLVRTGYLTHPFLMTFPDANVCLSSNP